MKLKEEIQEIKRLMGEATVSSNAGSYETPLPVDTPVELEGEIISVEIGDDAPEVDMVDLSSTDEYEDMGHGCQSSGEAHPDMSHEEWSDEEDVDLTDVFNSLGLFTETTINEQDDDENSPQVAEDPPVPDTSSTKEDEDWTGTTQDDMEKPILIQNLPVLAVDLEDYLNTLKNDIKNCEDGCNDIEVAKRVKAFFEDTLTSKFGLNMKTIDTAHWKGGGNLKVDDDGGIQLKPGDKIRAMTTI